MGLDRNTSRQNEDRGSAQKKKKTRILTNTSTAFLFFPLHFIVLEKFSAPLSWPVSLSSEDTDAV